MFVRLLFRLGITLFSLSVSASELEVLHWWTSGGEARSAQLLKSTMEAQGHVWKDFAVAGGGGESAMLVLKARAVSGNPPTAAQIKGHDIQEWAKLGFLTSLNDMAQTDQWDSLLPEVVSSTMKYQNKYVAVPVNIHRTNWLWANPEIFRKVGVSLPRSLDEFFAVADAIKAAGYLPLAHGSESWQDVTLFEGVALAVLGKEGYRKAFVDLDMETLSSQKMTEVFRYFLKFRDYIDPQAHGRDWSVATNMVGSGQAAMQLMGDWAKGEFTATGKIAGKDYVCIAAPGTEGLFSYNIDSFVFFKSPEGIQKEGQEALAQSIMAQPFQREFSAAKGSLPARTDVPEESFDLCSRSSVSAFQQAYQHDGLLPSLSQSMATTSYVLSAISDVVTNFFHDADADPEKAADRLARAIKAAL
ncbi:sugar ABC transporter substrate-binding protein [Vibrio sp. HA2012]|uniref:ABC transporter substrate-binding protein n=1 Tax=Vibrio sp. HA2012 TaxID=1971595 RepID=UPI000C2B8CAD|nr:ABC transporter substrate-binding protein [Vibrio sp. HA2012]PJC85175.1 sugar ABC transporter substrate-binding protein [Vibrio sp. HA2012]